MKTVLYLFTEAFPFTKNAEAFLEPEIKIAAELFDEIHIFPSSRSNISKDVRDLPYNNVRISPIKRETLYVEFIKSIPYIIKHKGFWEDALMFITKKLFFKLSAWKKLIFTLITEYAIVRHFKRNPYYDSVDANIVYYSYWLFGEAGGVLKVKKHKSIAVSRGHGTDIVGYPTVNNYSPLKKYYLDKLDMIYPVSNKGRDILVEQYQKYAPIPFKVKEKIHPIRLGIENTTNIKDLHFQLEHRPFTIISCSSIIPVKRLHLIIEALSHIKNFKLKWIHIGAGELFSEIKRKCDELLSENIIVEFKGALPRASVIDFYQNNNIHVFINVSASEGIPVSIMEAFSYGVPAIATNVGGTSELCNHGKNGFLLDRDFKAKDLSGLICKIAELVDNNPEEYLTLRSEAKQTIISDFSLNNHYELYNHVLLKSLKNNIL